MDSQSLQIQTDKSRLAKMKMQIVKSELDLGNMF